MDSLVKSLSGGERQRLFYRAGFDLKSTARFLDKLTTSLDSKNRREVWRIQIGISLISAEILASPFAMIDTVTAFCGAVAIEFFKGEQGGTTKISIPGQYADFCCCALHLTRFHRKRIRSS